MTAKKDSPTNTLQEVCSVFSRENMKQTTNYPYMQLSGDPTIGLVSGPSK